jgi:hypothetical protein
LLLAFDNLPFNAAVVFSGLPLSEQLFGPMARYVVQEMGEMDPNSDFAVRIANHGMRRWMPTPVRIGLLRTMGYDGLICYHRRHRYPVARFFWQERPSQGQGATANGRVDLHVFGTPNPDPDNDRAQRGYTKAAATALLHYVAKYRPDVCSLRFGRGRGINHAIIKHIELQRDREQIPINFVVAPEGWVHFCQ